jgi:regulator of protease activity HflC (stomatin/prohibitin superfamily)
MLGICYLKTPPTTYIIQYRGGRVVRQRAGASFFYFAPLTTLASIPLVSVDVPFIFQEVTTDFQDVTLQGQLTYRVTDPLKLSQLLDYTLDAMGRYVGDDPTKLNDRLIQLAQVGTHEFAQRERLESLLPRCAELGASVLEGLRSSEVTSMLGIEILSLSILSAKPTPEMAKAMQAEAREQLLGRADQAVFARRNTAIELERQIKENELNTERAVEEKRREVRQAQMQADVAIEQQRAELVDQQVANNRKLAEAQNEALRATLEAMKSVDWKTLSAAMGSGDARGHIAMAFQQLAENASKIGRLDISPDLLIRLLDEQRPDTE